MTFTYNPLSDEEAEKARYGENKLLPPGIYNFKVIKAEYKTSKSGNPQIELLIKITDKEGNQNLVNDWLIGIPKMEWKTRAFCRATRTLDNYDKNNFNETICMNLSGKASIIFKPGDRNPAGGYYPDKNIVEYYIDEKDSPTILQEKIYIPSKDEFNDNIPF